jgi:hypothetical protein
VLARAGSSAAAVDVKLVEAFGEVVVGAVVAVDDGVVLAAAVEAVVLVTAVVLVEVEVLVEVDVVVEADPVAGAMEKGAENTLGALKSF